MFGITTQITAVVVALTVSAGGAYIYKQRSDLLKQIETSQIEAKKYKILLETSTTSLTEALNINSQNKVFITRLEQEKVDIQISMNNLELHRRKDAVTINNLSETIRKQASNPANQVLLSPVLQDVIAQIQKNRDARQGEQK